jgi:hypothetical protein
MTNAMSMPAPRMGLLKPFYPGFRSLSRFSARKATNPNSVAVRNAQRSVHSTEFGQSKGFCEASAAENAVENLRNSRGLPAQNPVQFYSM